MFLGSARGKNVFTVDALGTGKTPRVIQVLGNGQKARLLAGQGCLVMVSELETSYGPNIIWQIVSNHYLVDTDSRLRAYW